MDLEAATTRGCFLSVIDYEIDAMNPLPRPPTAFVGRDEEITRALGYLRGGVRLLTLHGLGGVGKTRLALAVAARLDDRTVVYCDAVGVADEAELVVAIAAALGVDIRGLDHLAPIVAVAVAHQRVNPGKVVLIIDNFEHLAAHESGRGADVLVELLARVPELQLVVTSRVALMRPEEMPLAVQPLQDAAAVDLLLARARSPQWHADRAALQRLAARLDGLPLALELAAARAQLISPDALLALLDEHTSLALPGDPRRRSREAAVAWSWEQLGGRHEALTRLAVAGGSFDLDLSAAIVGGSRADALEVLELLARYSLLSPEQDGSGVRYRVLETVRDYALAHSTAAELEAAHAGLAEALLARVEPHVSAYSRELPPAVAAQVARDRDLYLAVLRRGLDVSGGVPLTNALRVAVVLVPLFQRMGFGSMATAWTSALLERDVDAVPLQTRLGAALVTVVAAVNGDASEVIDRLVAQAGQWLVGSPTAGKGGANNAALMITTAFGIVHYYRWDHPTLLALSDSLLRSDLAKSPEVFAYATVAKVTSGRALGRGDGNAGDAQLAEALKRLSTSSLTTACLVICTRAFLAIHRGDEARGLAFIDEGLARSNGTMRFFDALFHLERARAFHSRGVFIAADAAYAQAQSMFARSAQREQQETSRDRALLALERGRYDEVGEQLAATAPHLATSFERAWHGAIAAAHGALVGVPVTPTDEATGTIEDHACAALRAVAGGVFTAVTVDSFRVRRAALLAERANAVRAGAATVVAWSLDGSAVRCGATWVDLSTRPLIRTLLAALAEATLRGDEVVDRAVLERALWPDERLTAETRDQRLHTAISTLRKMALEDAIESHAGGYRLTLPVLRVAAEAWAAGEMQRARGRGRPKRQA